MSERRINREAWAELVADLIAIHTRSKKSPFARLIKVDPRTIDRWLDAEVDVSEESVRSLARALGWTAEELRNALVQVGYYQPEEMRQPERTIEDETDTAIQLVASNPKISVAKKKEIIEYLLDQAEQDQKRRLEAAKWMIRRAEAG